jgi:phage terminase small subunit
MTDKTFEKYKSVIDEWFVNGYNGTKAYQKIYPKSKYQSADTSFRKIFEITRIQEYVIEKRKAIAEANKITVDECVAILTAMARFDIADCYDEDGALKPIHEISKESRLVIESLETDEIRFDGVSIGQVKKLKTSSRRANLIELMKHLGGYAEHNFQKSAPDLSKEERDARIEELKAKLVSKPPAK